jgi:DNA polymerase
MAGLSLSQRLKAKLNSAKSQDTSSEQNKERVPNNNSSQEPSLASRLTQAPQINNNPKRKGFGNAFDASKASYQELHDYVMNCTHCNECSNRLNVLFGEGKLPSRLMVIGEGPGRSEDATGRLFVGPSGDFLSKWLSSIHLNMREDVYLSNIVKCFSGTNPTPQRANYCKQFLERQIDFVKPDALLVLGKVAANSLLNNELPLNQMREKDLSFKGIPVVVTYHPAAVLRNEQWKRPVWNDLKRTASILQIDLTRR